MNEIVSLTVYDYLRKTIQQIGYPPTPQEISSACGIEEALVIQSLNWLEAKKYLTRIPYKTRGIRLTALDQQWYCEDRINAFIRLYLMQHQTLPTIDEIAIHCRLSQAKVEQHIVQHYGHMELASLLLNPLQATA